MHGREPPPIEILEKLTAKGGDILGRTVENFKPPQRSSLVNGDSESGGDESKTPKDEKMDIDEPGSVGRGSRGKLVIKLMAHWSISSSPAHALHYRSSPSATSKDSFPAGCVID